MALALAVNNESKDGINDLEDQLSAVVNYFQEAEESSHEANKLAERDRDYYDNDQWTPEELAILRKRKQPAITVNKVKQKVEFQLGFERRVRSDPKAFPRNRNDEQASEAATDALRYIGDQNYFNEIRSDVYENLTIEGTGGVDVVAVPTPDGNYDIAIEQVPWDRIFYDPHSRKKDFTDAKYKGIVIWMDGDDARRLYPDKANAIDLTFSQVSQFDTYDDRPQWNVWADSKRKRVRIVQIHYKWEGKWCVATFTKGGFLVDPVVSPYVDKYGNPTSSLILRSRFIDRENNRYGDVRSLIPIQDEYNKYRSKALHLFTVRQTFGTKEAVLDTTKAKQELAKPDGHVELNPGAVFGQNFGVLPTGDMAAGNLQMMQMAGADLQAAGPNNALAGKGTELQSGRAIQAQQQGGAVEMEPGIDNLRMWTREVYEACWLRVKQFWTEEKWVRVTDDERNIKWVGLNKRVTLEDKLKQLPPEQAAAYMQQMGLQPNDPRLQEVVEIENDVSGLDIDIVIEEGPDISTLQAEQFEMLTNLAQSGIGIPPKAIIQASSIRNKDQILDEMEQGQALPPEVQKQMQEMQQALQQSEQKMRELEAQVADKQADYALKNRELDIKEGELQIKAMTAMKQESPQQPQGPTELDAAKQIADIQDTEANTEQTRVETALMIKDVMTPDVEVIAELPQT